MKITKNKNQYFSYLQKQFSKFAVVLVVVSMLFGTLGINQTSAYFTSSATVSGNTFTAGTLEMNVDVSDLGTVGLRVDKNLIISNDGSLPFEYGIKTEFPTTDNVFCNQLNISVKEGANILYSGNILNINFTEAKILESGKNDSLIINITDPSGSVIGKTCSFNFVLKAWQEELNYTQGFTDIAYVSAIVNSEKVVPTEPVDDDISPIADSYVKEDGGGNENNGNSGDLIIRSEDSNKNKRAFVRFDFHLPTGVIVSLSSLKLYMGDAPSSPRNYEIKSVLSSWVEGSINWNNQPSFNSTPTDTISSGTTNNQWKSWDVKNDIQAIVNGTSNNGWLLKDSIEGSSPNYEAKFNSSENSENKPILEITFSAPPATTNHLVINEVYYEGDNKKEWVELYNPTSSNVNLSGWKLCDNISCDTIGSYTITSHGFAVIVTSDSEFDHNWVLPSGAVKIVLADNTIGNGLANDGDRVILKNTSGNTTYTDTTGVVDKMSYGNDTTYMTLPDSGSGKSLARIIKGYDSGLADDWIINATPNPGTNPGSDGEEIIRFTSDGIEIASVEQGLEPLLIITNIEEEVITPEENLIEFLVELITPKEVVEEETPAEIVPEELLPSLPEAATSLQAGASLPADNEISGEAKPKEILPASPEKVTETEDAIVPETITEIPEKIEAPIGEVLEPEIIETGEPEVTELTPVISETEPILESAPAVEESAVESATVEPVSNEIK